MFPKHRPGATIDKSWLEADFGARTSSIPREQQDDITSGVLGVEAAVANISHLISGRPGGQYRGHMHLLTANVS